MDELVLFAQELAYLMRWNPQGGTKEVEKMQFIDALTTITALPSDSMSMEIRRLIVEQQEPKSLHVKHLVACLKCRDVLLKCKAANAIGSICMSRIAGQKLLDQYGEEILIGLLRMVSCKNQWAQGDACFVLGWIVVIADENILQQCASAIPIVMRLLKRYIETTPGTKVISSTNNTSNPTDPSTSDKVSNVRVYSLVLLLNFCQRNVKLLIEEIDHILSVLETIFNHVIITSTNNSAGQVHLETSESNEVLRLSITLLSLLVDQMEEVPKKLLDKRMVPQLLKLGQVLRTSSLREEELEDLEQRINIMVEMLCCTQSKV